MKKSKILLIPVFIFLLVFSCQNVSGGYDRNNSNTQTVSGVMQVSDLLPEEYSNLFSDTDEQERSAFPLKPSITTPTATISAVKAADDSVFTTVDQSDIDYSTGKFVVRNLRLDISYYIDISVTVSDTEILKGRSQSFTLTKDNSIKPDMNILLTPIVTENKTGNIQLSAEFVSGIKKIKTTVITNTANWPASLENTSSISSGGNFLDITGVPSGAYEILIEFLPQSEAAAPLYVTRQSINVFDGLTTKTWIGDDECISGGKLIVTDALIAKFNSIVDFFVDPVTGRSDNPGTWVAPLKNISEAFDKMNDSAKNYTVNIKSFEEPQIIDRSSVAANSVTIRGDGEGICIDAKKKGAALKINTPSGTTITLENLTLKNGENSSGGGLVIYGKSNVNLGNGVTISGNTATVNGGGVYIYGSNSTTYPTLTINTGAKISGNHVPDDKKGTGIYVDTYARVTLSGGEISGNTGGKYGGGAYIGSTGNFVFNSGEIKNNSATNGGAVYNAGSFTIGGTASIPYGGSVSNNDVYLASGKTLEVLNLSDDSTTVATITPENFKRGTDILSSAAGSLTSSIVNRFNLSQDNDGWNRVISADYKLAEINSPIYVVDSTDASNTRPSGFSKGKTSGATGTKTSPYASIAAALGCSELSLAGNTITIAGTVSSQAINSSTSISGSATNVTIEGYKPGNSASTAKIDAKNTANTTAFSINKSGLTVTIKNLTITGGNATNGGGINITKGTVVLTDGAVITGNEATYGGGVYVAGGNAVLLMNGKALIGDDATTATTAESTNATTYANKATDGAGIYIGNYAAVYLGYSLDSNGTPTTTNSALISNASSGYYGVRRNYASGNGGGIYSASNNLKIASGNVSYNQAATGGGIYFSAATTVDAGSIDGNKAQNGGGIYIASNTGITFKSVSMTANAAVGTSSAAANGGAVYNNGTLTLSDVTNPASMTDNYASSSSQNAYGGAIYNVNGGSVNINGAATLDNNSATTTGSGKKGYGGAIYNEGVVEMVNGKIGSENANRATSAGGAVYQNGTFKIKGDTNIKNGSATSNDVYVVTSNDKKVIMTGSLSANGNSSSNKMTITPDLIKRGKTVISSYNYTLSDTTDFPKFAVSFSTGWSMILHSSEGKLDADLYVSGTSSNDTNGDGTSSKPYGTLAKAIEQCWDTNKPYTIYVKGTLSGNHEISGTINAKSITLQGTGNSPCINAGASGRPLTINTSKEVIVTGLEITNGKLSSGDGGGIKVSGGCTLTLDDGAKITSNDNYTNNTDGKGGGLYIASDSTVIMKDGSLVNLNKAKQGGGVYNEGKLLMYGTARIGSTVTNYPKNPWAATPQTPTGNCSKDAGGGVYNRGTLCLGYSAWTGPTNNQTSNLSNGITGNFAGGQGGGVYTNNNDGANLYFNTGNISYNRSSDRGAGVYIYGTMTMTGGTMTSNCDDSNNGGAMHVNGNLYMSGNVNIPYGLVNDGTWYTNGAQNTVGVETNFDKVITLTENVTYSGKIKVKTTSVDSDVKVIQRDTSFTNVNNFKTSIGKFEFINNNLYKLDYKQISGTDYAVLKANALTMDDITSQSVISAKDSEFTNSGTSMPPVSLSSILGKVMLCRLYSDAGETEAYGALCLSNFNSSAKTLDYKFIRYYHNSLEVDTSGTINLYEYDDDMDNDDALYLGLCNSHGNDVSLSCGDMAEGDAYISKDGTNYMFGFCLAGGNTAGYYIEQ